MAFRQYLPAPWPQAHYIHSRFIEPVAFWHLDSESQIYVSQVLSTSEYQTHASPQRPSSWHIVTTFIPMATRSHTSSSSSPLGIQDEAQHLIQLSAGIAHIRLVNRQLHTSLSCGGHHSSRPMLPNSPHAKITFLLGLRMTYFFT